MNRGGTEVTILMKKITETNSIHPFGFTCQDATNCHLYCIIAWTDIFTDRPLFGNMNGTTMTNRRAGTLISSEPAQNITDDHDTMELYKKVQEGFNLANTVVLDIWLVRHWQEQDSVSTGGILHESGPD